MKNKSSAIRKWLKENGNEGFTSFDFKNKDLIFYDGGLVSIKKTVKIQRKRKRSTMGEDLKINSFACTIWFESLDDIIDYLTKTRNLLNKLGYPTSPSLHKGL